MQFLEKFVNNIKKIENNKFLNLKAILILYLISRFLVVLILYNTGPCNFPDCETYYNNVNYLVTGENMYQKWMEVGLDTDLIEKKADFLPFFYISISPFAFLNLSPWSIRLVFFIADFLNLLLIYNLAQNKNIASLAYLFAPIVLISGLIIPQDEIIVATYLLSSIYLFKKGHQGRSIFTLALAFSHKVFPIVLLPLFFLNAVIKKKSTFIPDIEYMKLFRNLIIFISTAIVLNSFYYPDWKVVYYVRSSYTGGHQSIWMLFPSSIEIHTFILISLLFLFFLYSYVKKLDLTTNYLGGSLIFFSLYPSLTFEHLIIITALFLVFTEINQKTVSFWVIFTIISLTTLPMHFIFTLPYNIWLTMMIITLIGFYLIIFEQIKKRSNAL